MRRLVVGLTIVSLLASYFMFFTLPANAAAHQVCWISEFTFRNDTASSDSASLSLSNSPLTHTYTASAILQPSETQTVSVHGFFPVNSLGFNSSATSATLTLVGFGNFGAVDDSVCAFIVVDAFGHIDDGRINAYDLAAPLAAYCQSGGIAVWDIDADGQGTLAFTSSADDISAALDDALSTQESQLIGEGLGDSLSALSSNQLALLGTEPASGKPYQFIASADVCS